MATDYKFGTPEPEDRKWIYRDVWATEETTGGGSRLVIAPAQGQTDLLAAFLQDMNGPFWVLYVLVIPRGSGEPGRYQSPEPQTASAVGTFLNEFSGFLETDGRHNLWIASESGSRCSSMTATISSMRRPPGLLEARSYSSGIQRSTRNSFPISALTPLSPEP